MASRDALPVDSPESQRLGSRRKGIIKTAVSKDEPSPKTPETGELDASSSTVQPEGKTESKPEAPVKIVKDHDEESKKDDVQVVDEADNRPKKKTRKQTKRLGRPVMDSRPRKNIAFNIPISLHEQLRINANRKTGGNVSCLVTLILEGKETLE